MRIARDFISGLIALASLVACFAMIFSDSAWEWWKHYWTGACDDKIFLPLMMFFVAINLSGQIVKWISPKETPL